MPQNSLGPNDAWNWVVSGWNIFLKNPVIWVVLSLIYVISLFVLNILPQLGALLAGLLTPALLAGMLFGAKEVEAGRELKPAHIFQAFQDQAKLVQLILVGLITFALTLLQKGVIVSDLPQVLVVLVGILLSVATASTLLFALPLIMLAGQTAATAVPASLRACFSQPLAIGLFFSLALLLFVLALLPLGLGLLIYLPVMVGAMLASYKQVI